MFQDGPHEIIWSPTAEAHSVPSSTRRPTAVQTHCEQSVMVDNRSGAGTPAQDWACAATPLSGPSWCTTDYNTPPEGQATFPRDFSPGPNSCWRAPPGSATTNAESRTPAVHSDPRSARSQCPSPESRRSIANSMRFPSNGFTYYLTFFSKFFSSFPHGTCSLSVSCQYSALDGVYHPFWAAFPNNPTHGKRIVNGTLHRERDCHPLWCAVPSNLSTG